MGGGSLFFFFLVGRLPGLGGSPGALACGWLVRGSPLYPAYLLIMPGGGTFSSIFTLCDLICISAIDSPEVPEPLSLSLVSVMLVREGVLIVVCDIVLLGAGGGIGGGGGVGEMIGLWKRGLRSSRYSPSLSSDGEITGDCLSFI